MPGGVPRESTWVFAYDLRADCFGWMTMWLMLPLPPGKLLARWTSKLFDQQERLVCASLIFSHFVIE
jgi:hypothetical protein